MQHSETDTVTDQRKFLEAIARRLVVRAEYNGAAMQLAPHQMFERHGELFIGALNMDKTWRSDEEPRLGFFKLKGLSNIGVTESEFDPLPPPDPALPRETDTMVFAV
ncbi:MAG: hypothetical protein JSR96_05315 [Proteobacteria bacterium]|nr:hypothetical protein [Pseudomonadota bacterium]